MVDGGRRVLVRFADADGGEVELAAPFSVADGLAALRAAGGRFRADGAALGGDLFGAVSRRAGVEGTLHRVSAMPGEAGADPQGLTYRLGRHLLGAAAVIGDLLARVARRDGGPTDGAAGAAAGGFMDDSGDAFGAAPRECESLLLLGPPGAGKTTLLRNVARALADNFRLGGTVVVVDGAGEVAGGVRGAHPCVGCARRMRVPASSSQEACMRQAVQNQGARCVVVDEVGSPGEAAAARVIAPTGVSLVATAHGVRLRHLVANPELAPLVGGVATTTLGDEAAGARGGRKTAAERRAPPTFNLCVEVVSRARWRVHWEVAAAVDAILAGQPFEVEERWLAPDGRLMARRVGG